ncbi:MAG: hypothetical protein AB7E47_05930 [Desulfovibrionaceae bacterium]
MTLPKGICSECGEEKTLLQRDPDLCHKCHGGRGRKRVQARKAAPATAPTPELEPEATASPVPPPTPEAPASLPEAAAPPPAPLAATPVPEPGQAVADHAPQPAAGYLVLDLTTQRDRDLPGLLEKAAVRDYRTVEDEVKFLLRQALANNVTVTVAVAKGAGR